MFNNRFKFDAAADLAKSILEADAKVKMEELKGKQTKLDKNHNGKLDAQDFKILRGEKKVNEQQGVAEGLTEMDNRTPSSDRREQRANSPEAKAQREKEQQERLKKVSPEMRKKLGLPEPKEQGVAEDYINEAEADYQSSYRVGKVANFKPKASDVGQGRKITGKMGKYGKQPDDDNMVEPPPEHKVGDVKTDPSAVVPGHSTMGAKLHLASLPKDAEGNTIHKGARRVNAADLVAKRKAMMAGQKNEEVEGVEEASNLALRGLFSTDPKKAGQFLSTEKGKQNRAKKNVPDLKAAIKRQLGRHPKPNLPEEVESIEEEMEDTLHPAGAALLKHIKPEHHNLYKAHLTKDVFNGGFGDRHAVLKAAQDAGHLKMDLKKQNEEVEELDERELTSGETAEKERIVHGMKKSLKGFKARYGDRAKEVMYATATKQAKKD